MDLRIERYLAEQFNISQRPIQFTGQDRLKIDLIHKSVIKFNPQYVGTDDINRRYAIDFVSHILLAQRRDWLWQRPGN